ncbi:MipA/OmpV family protein [bacterium]|nr:MipA/OmpV family protein [bacterium]MBU1995154.1 MipA/OmpV family protein [bacterium]
MKYIIILTLFFLQVFAEDAKQKVAIGAGPYIQTQPYTNADDIVIPSPVIFFDNGIAYVRWTRAGIYFLGQKQEKYAWGFSLTAQPRPYGYKPSDSKDLQGMEERKNTWEGGIAFSTQIDKTNFEIMALTDLLNRYDSWLIKAELGYEFTLGDFSFYPSFIAIYQSSEFINYYYGVKQSEATIRDAYFPHADMQYGAQSYISYPFTDALSLLINIRADKLSDEAKDSPLVNDDFIYSGLLSLIYTFEY